MTYTVFIQCCVSGETQADADEVCNEESEQEENDNEKTSKREKREEGIFGAYLYKMYMYMYSYTNLLFYLMPSSGPASLQ